MLTRRLPWWVLLAVVGGASMILFVILNPPLIFTDSTPAGGDMGAHVYAPAYLRDVLLPQGRVLGWSNDWYAGFPVFYFYFPLPSLTIVLFDLVLPYGVAFKLVTVLGVLALPPCVYYMGRSLRLGRGMSMVVAAGSLPFALMESYSIYGGNIASTLAGEFAYTWSFSLGMVYLGLLTRTLWDDRKYLPWAALALGVTALSHILTTIVLAIASLAALFWRKHNLRALMVGVWGFLIAGFWALPLLFRIGYSSDMAWTPLNRWEELLPIELWIPLLLAIPGAVWAVRRSSRFIPLVVATLVAPIYFPLPHILPDLFPNLFLDEHWKLWNGRLLPYWYFGVTFFAALAVGAWAVALVKRFPERISGLWPRIVAMAGVVAAVLILSQNSLNTPDWLAFLVLVVGLLSVGVSLSWIGRPTAYGVLLTITAAVVGLGGLAGLSFVNGWARWNYSGYEGKDPWPEYRALMDEIDQLPPGRIQWEVDSSFLDRYGTPMALMLFPYWTGAEHPSMEGLFFESSVTTPFHFLNSSEVSQKPSNPIPGLTYRSFDLDRGLEHLQVYGVRYYVAFSDESKSAADLHPDLSRVGEADPFVVYELPTIELVEVAEFQPVVYQPGEPFEGETTPGFFDLSLEWYDNTDNLDQWVTETGPSDWPRVASLSELPRQPLSNQNARISGVEIDQHRISFRTNAVGQPHLVKVSYFPNWIAEGAEGPYFAAPSLMVVVPTSEQVVLEFRSDWPENLGIAFSVVGLLGLAGWGGRKQAIRLFRRVTRRSTEEKAPLDKPLEHEPTTPATGSEPL